jgi:hypothetical protein
MLPFPFYTYNGYFYYIYMNIEILVPESLDEINLDQYQRFIKLNTKENEGSSFLMQKMIEIFCNLDLKDIAKIKYSSVQTITQKLNHVFSKKTKLINKFKIGDTNFGFIPDLDNMTLGEYIDLDTYFGDWDNMHKAMSVLYRPIKNSRGDLYNIEDYDGTKYSDVLKHMPLDVVFGSIFFFYNLSSELLTATLNYLEKEAENNLTTQQKEILEKNGLGINQSMDLVREILPNSMK